MSLKKWLQVSFVNLLIIAVIGVVLRYKIAFSLPFIDQKKLLHGHSHFAFAGWVTQALMAIIVSRLSAYSGKDLFKRYQWLLYANLICAYGMLITFPLQGYSLFSITFSTLSLFVSYFFMGYVWSDAKQYLTNTVLRNWIKAATLFNALSSIGAFSLAYMMAAKNMHQSWYLAAVYFFLHFQYNGWFSFTVLGLLFEKLEQTHAAATTLKNIFSAFFFSFFPAYFFSAMWIPIPDFVYVIVVLSAITQLAAWAWAIQIIHRNAASLKSTTRKAPRIIIILSLVAFSIKLLLQAGSTVPSLSTVAYGFRPIVVGYLHLVFLGFVSLFIMGYSEHIGILPVNKWSIAGISTFITGVIFNELVLMVQGIAAMSYTAIPLVNEFLLGIALIIFFGILLICAARNIATDQGRVAAGKLEKLS